MVQQAQLIPFLPTSKASASKLGYVGRKPGQSRDSDAWFTPSIYIDSVKAVMGSITLDPFSSAEANTVVGAGVFFSPENSAFDNDWHIHRHTKVFMNPPYSSKLIKRAVNCFIDQWIMKSFEEGIVLVNNATDTQWFRALSEHCSAICFTNHRISFWNRDGKSVSGNTRGQAFVYFGKNIESFHAIFSKHGLVVEPVK